MGHKGKNAMYGDLLPFLWFDEDGNYHFCSSCYKNSLKPKAGSAEAYKEFRKTITMYTVFFIRPFYAGKTYWNNGGYFPHFSGVN
jgi:hypothetical protein